MRLGLFDVLLQRYDSAFEFIIVCLDLIIVCLELVSLSRDLIIVCLELVSLGQDLIIILLAFQGIFVLALKCTMRLLKQLQLLLELDDL